MVTVFVAPELVCSIIVVLLHKMKYLEIAYVGGWGGVKVNAVASPYLQVGVK